MKIFNKLNYGQKAILLTGLVSGTIQYIYFMFIKEPWHCDPIEGRYGPFHNCIANDFIAFPLLVVVINAVPSVILAIVYGIISKYFSSKSTKNIVLTVFIILFIMGYFLFFNRKV